MLRAITIGIGLAIGFSQFAAAHEPKTHIVRVVSDYHNLRMYFEPKRIVVQPGDTVTWVNEASEDHDIVSYPDGYPKGAKPLSSPFLKKKNERWSHTFEIKGTYEYHCIPHLPMGMHGVVIVSRPSQASEFHVPTALEMKRYAKRLREFFDEEEFKYRPRNKRSAMKKDAAPKASRHH